MAALAMHLFALFVAAFALMAVAAIAVQLLRSVREFRAGYSGVDEAGSLHQAV